MLDAPDLDVRDVLAAVKAWQPDAACLAAGDDNLTNTLRCYAAAGLSDSGVESRILHRLGVPPVRYDDAAIVVARHCAIAGMSFAAIIEIMVYLAVEVPGWLDDPDAIAALVRSAIAEAGA